MSAFVLGIILFILGVVVGHALKSLKNKRYDGYLDVSEQNTSQIHQLEITTEPEELKTQASITLKVRKIPSES